MPIEKQNIQDIAVVSETYGPTPIGEAPQAGDYLPPMSQKEREDTVQRLKKSVDTLMVDAQETYQSNCHKPGTQKLDRDYMTRLSTNEFFFYTREPLTLEEFQTLQNEIADKAKTISSGVQLILGSFAVKTSDDKVMNVTPHITCGEKPDFNFILKNLTSPIDVRYKIQDENGERKTLGVFDSQRRSDKMPQITVDGVTKNFSFNNIIPSKTPKGELFYTAVDICLDHKRGVAKANYNALIEKEPSVSQYPVSHVVVSNWTRLYKEKQITAPMHVDPTCSPNSCQNNKQQRETSIDLTFGENLANKFTVECPRFHLKNDYAHKVSKTSPGRKHAYAVSINNTEFHQKDTPSSDFKNRYKELTGDHLKTKILKDFKRKIEKAASKEQLSELKKEIMTSHEYDVLKTGQGKFTRKFGIKTSSVKALENMFKQKESHLSKSAGPKFSS